MFTRIKEYFRKEKNLSRAIFGTLILIIVVAIFVPAFADFTLQNGGSGYGYGYGYGNGYGADGGANGYRTTGGNLNQYGYGFGYVVPTSTPSTGGGSSGGGSGSGSGGSGPSTIGGSNDAGCTTGAMFSSTTGARCSTTTVCPAGATYSPTTGALCTSNVGTASCSIPAFARNLTLGSTGADVSALQQYLAGKGLFALAPTGYFGPITQHAVASFQGANGISPAAGYFGPITRAFVNAQLALTSNVAACTVTTTTTTTTFISSTTGCFDFIFTRNLTVGSKGNDVAALQSYLVQKGYMTIPSGIAYGYFGNLTKAGVSAFQKANGISPTAGYFGPKTRAFLNAQITSAAQGGICPR